MDLHRTLPYGSTMVMPHRMREEVVKPHIEAYDADAGVADMLDDAHQAQFAKGREEEMEAAA